MHLFKFHIGVSILTTSYAFSKCGIVAGPLALLLVVLVYFYTIWIHVRSAELITRKHNLVNPQFHEVVEYAFAKSPKLAKVMSYLVSTLISLGQFFCVCGYVIFIRINVTHILTKWAPKLVKHSYYSTSLLGVLGVALLLICSVRKIENIVGFSSAGNVVILASIGIVVYYISHNVPDIGDYPGFTPVGLPITFAIMASSLEGIFGAMPVKNGMKNPSSFIRMFALFCIGYVMLMGSFGLLGYARFGRNTQIVLIFNLPNSPLYASLKVLYSVVLYFTYPIQAYVVVQVVLPRTKQICQKYFSSVITDPESLIPEYTVRYLIVLASCGFGYLTDDLAPLLTLYGSLSTTTIGFIVPVIVDFLVCEQSAVTQVLNILVITLGAIATVAGTAVSIYQLSGHKIHV